MPKLLAVVAAGLGLAHAMPNPMDLAAPPCTGMHEPKFTAPMCYSGSETVIGMSEQVDVKLTAFAGDKGQVDIIATGVSPEHCVDLVFARDPSTNELKMDQSVLKSCLSGATAKVVYCSDQDAVQVHVAVPHLPVPSVPATLKRIAC